MNNKYFKFLLIALIIAIVVPQITLAAWWNPFSWNWNSLFHRQNINKNPNIVGGDKDEHGCIGSAGYTWCQAKSKCLRVWEEPCETTTTQPSITVVSPNGGEAITQGQKYNITWKSSGLKPSDNISISLNIPGSCQGLTGCQKSFSISSGSIKNTGSYVWDTNKKMGGGSTGPNSVSVLPGQDYKIEICKENICDSSNNSFSITSSNQAAGQISDITIINAINKAWGVQLVKNANGTYSTTSSGGQGGQYYSVDLITKGDLNNDGLQDAIIKGSGCGATCGSIFTVIINKNNNSVDTFRVEPEEIITSSAVQSSINKITINNGVITINATLYNLDGQPTSNLNYKFVGNKLIKNN